jgi:nitroreductase
MLDRVVHVVRRDVDGQSNFVLWELLDLCRHRAIEPDGYRAGVDVEDAIRRRRTHKQYGDEPVDEATLLELVELARHAPNHKLTNPWRFRVLGPETRRRIDELVDENEAQKLGRAPTLVLATAIRSEDPLLAEEDVLATGCAVYAILLGATARGLGSYWRTPGCFRQEPVRDLLGLAPHEEVVSLIHLGTPASDPPGKERAPVAEVLTVLP